MQIIKGTRLAPPRVLIYSSEEKFGKTTFAADAETPLFIPTEDGADAIGPDRFPRIETFQQFQDACDIALEDTEHATIVIDNLSGLEQLVHQHVVENVKHEKGHKVESIEDYGYGKGYVHAEELWSQQVIPVLDDMHDAGKVVIVIAHGQIRRLDSPDTEPYDQYTLDLHKNASALFRKWADVIMFGAKKVSIEESDVGFNKKVKRGSNRLDKREWHTVSSPAWVAGNRYGMPSPLPFPKENPWSVFVEAMTKRAVKGSVREIVKNGMKEEGVEK